MMLFDFFSYVCVSSQSKTKIFLYLKIEPNIILLSSHHCFPPSTYSKDDCTKTYKIGEELGRGSFAIVKRAQHLKEKTDWAVKVFDKVSDESWD